MCQQLLYFKDIRQIDICKYIKIYKYSIEVWMYLHYYSNTYV